MRNTIFLPAAIMLITGCLESSAPSEEQVRAAIADQLRDIEAMTNEGHPGDKVSALYMEYFAANPSVLPYGGQLLKGRSEVSAFYTKNLSLGTIVSNVYTEPTIEVADGFAVRTYEGTAEIRLSGSNELLRYTNVYSDALVPENGTWKMLWHSWVPAPADD